MYEHRGQRPLSLRTFQLRLAKHVAVASLVVAASLAGGMAGYAYFETLSWPDAFLHAATVLGGLGLIASPATAGGKLFAGLYALYAGLVFVAVTGIVLAPVAHRVLHRFHWDDQSWRMVDR